MKYNIILTLGDETMQYIKEKPLRDFDFWSGAIDTVNYLLAEEIDKIEQFLESETFINQRPFTDTEINDFFWHEDDKIAEILNYDSFDDIMRREDTQ